MIFILSLKISFAQTYIPFPDSIAKWSEETYTQAVYVGAHIYEDYIGSLYSLGNDTTINSVNYTMIGYQDTWRISFTPDDPTEIMNSEINFPGKIFGAIREDTSKKVWFRNFYSNPTCFHIYTQLKNLPADTEILIYDFNLQYHDTLSFGTRFYGYSKKVTKIDSVKLQDNIYHKRLHFSCSSCGEFIEETWIEGIGSSNGLFANYSYPLISGGNYVGSWLNCFSSNGNSLYKNDAIHQPDYDIECDSVYGDEIKTSVSFFPNPASDFLNFKFLFEGNYKIDIINILGETLVSTACNSTLNQIDISNLQRGIYFVIVNEPTNIESVFKLVKL